MSTSPSEYRFETHIEKSLQNHGYTSRAYTEYNKNLCLVEEDIIGFIKETQKEEYQKLQTHFDNQTDSHLCKTINDTIGKRGIVDALRKGVSTRGCSFNLVYFQPKSGLNQEHHDLFQKNRFVVIRQLHYSNSNNNSIDMGLFLNGIPILTMELKNQLTGQNVKHSENQYKYDRNPKEPLLNFKRCMVHFCIDNDVASMATRLSGEKTKFFPYNKDISNPIVQDDYRTEYIWNEVLTPNSLLDIIENFAVIVEESSKEWNDQQKRVIESKDDVLVFPRYHQLQVIRNLRHAVKSEGVGNNYLIQHSPGSGKSYSIGWLSHTLSSFYQNPTDIKRMFDSIIVITDRKVLDKQLQKTLKDLQQTDGVVNPVDLTSKQLKEYLEKGKDIIITTIQKFGVISQAMSELKGNNFAVVIDEVHSSQSGENSKQLKRALLGSDSDDSDDDELDFEEVIRRELEARGKQKHISFFGFTATPKPKTLEIFGKKNSQGNFVPFHIYSMKQSIAEGFTLDVLEHYTTYKRYFKVQQTGEEDIELPEGKVKRELVNFVDSHPEVIRQKVAIILEHFVNKGSKEIAGKARGMIVVRSRKHCVLFQEEMKKQMRDRNLPYSCLVAFSGVINHNGRENTETLLNQENGMEGNDIPTALKDPRYRLLIVSSKFQTGFDEPLLYAMYVDKKLGGVQCVQTLTRLNRTKTGKTGTFVLDFVNETEEVVNSFQPFYTSTELVGETDPDKLYDLEYKIEQYKLFTQDHIDRFCVEFYKKTDTDQALHPIIDEVVENWKQVDSEETKENFKSDIQSFCRLYSYIAQIASFTEVRWEKLYVFLRYLNKKLPKKEGSSVNIKDSIDLESLRIQFIADSRLSLEEKKGELEPMSDGGSTKPKEEEKELLSQIIKRINELFGIQLTEEDALDILNVEKRIAQDEALMAVMMGNNSEDAKKDYYNSLVKESFTDYYSDRMDFYRKVMNPKILPMLLDGMYSQFRKNYELKFHRR